MAVIGFYGSSNIEGWRMKLSQYLNDFKIVDLVSAEGEQADIALVWAPPAGQLKKNAEFAWYYYAGPRC